MARPLRVEFPGAWFHVMNRGQCKRQIFFTNNDRKTFLDIVADSVETFKIQIHAYALLDNHYHLLIHTPEMGLMRAMRHINGVYTQKFNIVHHRDGPLFRGRYKAKLVEKDEYLLELVRYIHMNAVEAGLVRYPRDYLWSSHRPYLEPKYRPEWLMVGEVLGYFGRREKTAIKAFDEFVCSGVPETFRAAMQNDSIAIGSGGFKEWIHENFIDTDKKSNNEFPAKSKRFHRKVVHWRDILTSVAFAHDVPKSALRCKQPGRKNDARLMAMYLTRRLTGKTHREVAQLFNVGNEYTIAKVYERFKKRLEWDRELKLKIDAICNNILYNVKT